MIQNTQNSNLNKNHGFIIATLATIFISTYFSLFQVNEVQTIFVVEFGKIVKTIDKPGLHLKLPLIQEIVIFDKRILEVYLPAREVIALDQKRLIIDAYTKYKIVDTKSFYETVRNESGAKNRISSVLDSVMRQVIAKYQLSSLLTEQRTEIMDKIQLLLSDNLSKFGIEVIDVRIIEAELPVANMDAMFQRMKTEREKEAKELRSQGLEEAKIIRAKADKKVITIKSEAQMKANVIKGKADAEATKIYTAAFSKDPEFYKFYKTLDIYQNTLKGKDMIIGIGNNNFFEILKK
jgi:membrane protease subunit HflC